MGNFSCRNYGAGGLIQAQIHNGIWPQIINLRLFYVLAISGLNRKFARIEIVIRLTPAKARRYENDSLIPSKKILNQV